MAGAKDRYADPHRHSVRLHRALPQSELKLISGAGHMIHHTAPRQVMAAIEAVAQPA
jgi:pimeloyl-ACP methyl ester carboxylesterase